MNAPALSSRIRNTDSTIALDERVAAALAEYADGVEKGHAVSKEDLLTKYADVADELADCLDSLEFIHRVAPQLTGTRDHSSEHEIRPQATLGDFLILREIGRGGMGVVYEAEQLSLGRRVALKVLPFAGMLDKQQLKRFKNEARAAATLDHPHIVVVHSVGEQRGVHYFAMQLVEGQSLAEMIGGLRSGEQLVAESTIERTKCDTDTRPMGALSTVPDVDTQEYFRLVTRLGIQAAEALDHAHQQGVVHRDVKPGNLLVDTEGKLYVTDFGLARLEADAGMTMTGDLVGTLRYMSPEQALAKRSVVDHRTDVYSLGVTLYELLALRAVYETNDRQELLKQIAFDEPRRLRQVNSRIPPDLETIVAKAMEKEPADRYATAGELAEDLRRYLSTKPIKAQWPGLTQRINKWSRRHMGLVWSALLLTALVMAVLGLATAMITDSRNEAIASRQRAHEERALAIGQRNLARRNQYFADIVAGQSELENGNIGDLQRKLRDYLPLGDWQDNRGWEWYYLMSMCRPEYRTLRPEKIGDDDQKYNNFACWSPDGRWIGVPGAIWDPRTGKCIQKIVPSFSGRQKVHWSPDGNKFAWGTTSPDASIYVIDPKTKTVDRVNTGQESVWCVAFSPDGSRLASGGMDRQVTIRESNDYSTVEIFPTDHYVNTMAWSPDATKLAATTSYPAFLIVWDLATKAVLTKQEFSPKHCAVNWHPNGEEIAVSTSEACYLLSTESWEVDHEFQGTRVPENNAYRSYTPCANDWSPDGSQIAVAFGNDVKVWNTGDHSLETVLQGHRWSVNSVDWHPNDGEIVTADGAGFVKVWDLDKMKQPVDISCDDEIRSVAWSRDSSAVSILSPNGSQANFNITSGALESRVPTTTELPHSLADDRRSAAIAPKGESIVSVIAVPSGEILSELPIEHDGRIRYVFLSRDGRRAAIGLATTVPFGNETTESFVLQIWDVENERPIAVWDNPRGPSDHIFVLAWNDDGSQIALVSYGDAGDSGSTYWAPHLHVIDATTGKRLVKFHQTAEDAVCSLSWSTDQKRIAQGTSSGWLEVIDLTTRKRDFIKQVSNTRISSIAWSRDDRLVACATTGGELHLVSSDSKATLLRLPLPDKGPSSLSWSPDGEKLAAATLSGTIRIWNAARGFALAKTPEFHNELALEYLELADSIPIHEKELALRQFLGLAPDALGFWDVRGMTLAELGDYDAALREFDKDIGNQLQYSVPADIYRAFCLLGKNDFEAYRMWCSRLFDMFHDSPMRFIRSNVAWLCALTPDQTVEASDFLPLTGYSPEIDLNDIGDSLSIVGQLFCGAALYRDGQYEKARVVLSKVAELRSQGTDRLESSELAYAQYFLAMTLQQLRHHRQAQSLLEVAMCTHDDLSGTSFPWVDQVALEVLREEATQTIQMSDY